jgi:hypothetical protein
MWQQHQPSADSAGGATLAGLAAFARPLPVPPIDPSTAARAKRVQSTASTTPPQSAHQCATRTTAGVREAAREYARERSRKREQNTAARAHRAAVLAPIRNGYVRPPPALKPQANKQLDRIARQRRASGSLVPGAIGTMASAAAVRLDAAATFIQALVRGWSGRQLSKEEKAKVVARAEALRERAVAMRAHAALPAEDDPAAIAARWIMAARWIDAEHTQAAWEAADARAAVAARAPARGVAGWTVALNSDPLTSGSPASAMHVWTNGQWPTHTQG